MKKIIVFSLVVGFLMAGLVMPTGRVLAQSNDDLMQSLRAQIQVLLDKINVLQDQLAARQGGGTQWCHTFNTNLRVGDRGEEVAALHRALENEGFSVPDGEKPQKDGDTVLQEGFGDPTASLVTGFQNKYKDEILTPNGLQYGTGYVGVSTRKKLNQLYGCGQGQVTPKPAPIELEQTSLWKTYRNDTYGFSIKYPANWLANGSWSGDGGFFYVGFGTSMAADSKPLATLKIYPDQTTLDKFVKYFDYLNGNWKDITLNNVAAKEIVSIGQNSKQFVLIASVKNSYGYELESTAFGDNVDTVRKISSTFEFLTTAPTLWKTYRNEKYGFEFQYPKTVTYVDINEGGYIWQNGVKDGIPADVAFKETSDFSKSFEVLPGAFPIFVGGLSPISLGVTVLNIPSNFTTLENYVVKIKASREAQGQGASGTNNQAKVIQIGSEKAIEITQSDFSANLNASKDIVFKRGNYLYVFNYSFSQNAITGLRDEMTGQYFFAKDGSYVFDKMNYDIIQKILSTLTFTVSSAPTEPQLQITSPIEGGQWKAGTALRFSWSGSNQNRQFLLAIKTPANEFFLPAGRQLSVSEGGYSWNIPKDFAPGTYKVALLAPDNTQTLSDNTWLSVWTSFSILSPSMAQEITVLSPNGGEKWMLNSSVFIKWTPDPESNFVEAYLEKKQGDQFVTVGKVVKAGKGSIQWYPGEIDRAPWTAMPGDGYYIRLVNTQTGVTDRSDNPFTILPADYMKVDLKIDGSDSPISVPTGGRNVKLTWTSVNADSCNFLPSDLGDAINGLPPSGERTVFLKENKNNWDYAVAMICSSPAGSRNDYVNVLRNIASSQGITIVSPNGGEILQQGRQFTIKWNSNGDPLVTVTLYLVQNNVGVLWIGNVPNTDSYVWNVPTTFSGSNFKILINGGGGGESAAPFSIVGSGSTVCGDINADGVINAADVTAYQNYIFSGGTVPAGVKTDLNGDGVDDILDLTMLIDRVQNVGPAPTCGSNSIPKISVDYLIGPSSLVVGQYGVWNLQVTSPKEENLNYDFEFGDGWSSNSTSKDSGLPSYRLHSYSSPGTYSVDLKIRRANTSDVLVSRRLQVNVAAPRSGNQPPAVSIPLTGPDVVVSGISNTWSITASDPNGDALGFSFYWGDGNTTYVSGKANSGVLATASHTYTRLGSYTIYVSVEDSIGGGTVASRPVTVSQSSPPPINTPTAN